MARVDDTFRGRLAARAARLDPPYRAEADAAAAHLRASGMAGRVRRAGDRAPDFALDGPDGGPFVLAAALAEGPVVLSFFRGEWCPFCRIEMDALLAAAPRFRARGARLVLVTAEAPSPDLRAAAAGAPATLLHDRANGVGLAYGLVFRMPDGLRRALLGAGVDLAAIAGSEGWLLPIPATYLVAPDGTIALAHGDPDFTRRLDPAEILARL